MDGSTVNLIDYIFLPPHCVYSTVIKVTKSKSVKLVEPHFSGQDKSVLNLQGMCREMYSRLFSASEKKSGLQFVVADKLAT